MKLMEERKYKNDPSDIVGILIEREELADILKAVRVKKQKLKQRQMIQRR